MIPCEHCLHAHFVGRADRGGAKRSPGRGGIPRSAGGLAVLRNGPKRRLRTGDTCVKETWTLEGHFATLRPSSPRVHQSFFLPIPWHNAGGFPPLAIGLRCHDFLDGKT